MIDGVTPERGRQTPAEFETWMRGSRDRLLRTAYLLTGENHTASDLVAESLAKVYLSWHRVEPDRRDAYARRVLLNTHHSWWRRAWRRREISSGELPETPVADPAYDGAEADLWQRLATLPRRQREVLVLRYYEQLSVAETADVLGVSVGTVKSQSSRALSRLRHEMDQEEEQ